MTGPGRMMSRRGSVGHSGAVQLTFAGELRGLTGSAVYFSTAESSLDEVSFPPHEVAVRTVGVGGCGSIM